MSLPDRHLGDRAAALVDGRLPPGERATVLDHLARCAPCRVQYDEQQVIKGLLSGLRGVDAPDDLTLRLARMASPSLPDPHQSYLAPTRAAAPVRSGDCAHSGHSGRPGRPGRPGRRAGQRVRLAGASLLSVSVVGVGVAYAAGAAPAGLAVVPPVDRFARAHAQVAGGLALAEPILAPTAPAGGSAPIAPSTAPSVPTAQSVPTALVPTGLVPTGLVPTALPLSTTVPTQFGAAPTSALALLRHAMAAESRVAFVGTEVVQRTGLADQQLLVAHLPGRGTVVTSVGGTGPTKAVFDTDSGRWDDLVLGLLSGSYTLVVQPDGVALGRRAHVVQAVRADGSLAAQFRLDALTGIVLDRAQFDRSGTLVQAAGFTQLTFRAAMPNHLPPMLPSTKAAALSTTESTRWSAAGWPCPNELAGLTLVGASGLAGTGDPVLHLTYSDGLSVVSIFIQSGHLDDSVARNGRTATVGGQQVLWAADGWVFTVVSDVAGSSVADVVAALPHDQPAGVDVPDRLTRGAGRMLSWLNPLD